jgi:hypothetical protein
MGFMIGGKSCSNCLVLGALLLALPMGCRQAPEERSSQVERAGRPLPVVLDPMKLRGELYRFLDETYSSLVGICNSIAARATDPKVRESTLRFKIRTIYGLGLVANEEDPRRQYILTWLMFAQSRLNYTVGPAKTGLAEFQGEFVAMLEELEKGLLELGRAHFDPPLIERARADIESLAARYPLTPDPRAEWLSAKVVAQTSPSGSVMKLIQMPISPFTGLQGVADSSTAIQGFTRVAGDFAEIVRQLPRRSRWESEMLLYELDSLESMVALRANMERASRSIESLSRTAESLPEELQKRIEDLIASAEGFQATLRGNVEAIQKALLETQETLAKSETTAAVVKDATSELARAGAQWESTAKAVESVLSAYKSLAKPAAELETAASENAKAKPGAAEQWGEMAGKIQTASLELRGLIEDLESGKLKSAVAEIRAAADASLDRAADRADSLADRLTRGLYVLAGAVFAGFIVYRVLGRARSRSAAGPP